MNHDFQALALESRGMGEMQKRVQVSPLGHKRAPCS
ncbi:PUM2 isoform 8 [Pan troglodytes]|uniref:Pumilio RNA binding family member 2 n=3 Tax=Hominidae TaxID=9604 RepID=F2Z366_HUMAN|nr:PUM2 isoform 1 [Pan troglodytes]PNI72646.1 PUM2 isoform 8 [Pan troglodytes]PNJ11562.1 PUM2 isoform 11 [Pongo abelii]PNJ11563.1 PUM2 isoform 12 [Pongo abelii]